MEFLHHGHHPFLKWLGATILIVVMIISAYSLSGTPFVLKPTIGTPSTMNSLDHSTSLGSGPTSSVTTLTSLNNGPNSSDPSTKNATQDVSTGIIVPIFSDYSRAQLNYVNEVIQAKSHYPSVPILAVINPSGGPGVSYNLNFSSEVKNMQAANVTVLGYVPTAWGARNITSVKADILKYYDWYHVNGLQLDQMPNWEYDGPQGQLHYSGPNGTFMPTYFSNLTSYAKSLGMTKVYGNSGADVPQNFLGTVDIIGIFENPFAAPFISSPTGVNGLAGVNGWHMNYSKTNFAFFSYNLTSVNPYYIVAASDYVGYLFLTNGTEPQPYNVLPPYFDLLVSTLASIIPVTIQSEVLNGTSVNTGFQTIVTQPDGISSMGFTPFTFDALSGSTVTISAGNYSGYTFDHWGDGITNSSIDVTPTQAMTLIAYYLH